MGPWKDENVENKNTGTNTGISSLTLRECVLTRFTE